MTENSKKASFTALSQVFLFCCVAFIVGCSGGHPLMPTPNLYADQGAFPAEEIPESLQTSKVELLYVTDRKKELYQIGRVFYGIERSNSLAIHINN